MTTTTIEEYEEALVSVRLGVLDYYMSAPIPDLDPVYSVYRCGDVKRVPVLRALGPTSGGQKACVHIHGAFPYIYVPAPLSGHFQEFAFKLAMSLDRALNLSLGFEASNQHVFQITPVQAKSMYGYQDFRVFLKIFFYNPFYVKKAADLMQNGAVMDQVLDPYESHIPYTQQFMIDYNLQGMNSIHFGFALFRRGEEEFFASHSLNREDLLKVPSDHRRFELGSLSEELLCEEGIKRMSKCSLEIDVVAADILNKAGFANPGLKDIWKEEAIRRTFKGLSEVKLENPSSPDRAEAQNKITESEIFWKRRLDEIIGRAEPSCRNQARFESSSSLPPSNFLQTHVPSLDRRTSILESSQSQDRAEDSLFLDETIVDEEVVSSLSQVTLNEDDRELINLLVDDKDEDYESSEMTQIMWDSDPFSQE